MGHVGYINGDDDLEFNFSYTHKTTSLYKLEKERKGTISLNSSDDSSLNIVLGYILASPNDTISFIVGDNYNNQQQLINDNTGTTDFSISLTDFTDEMITSLNNVNDNGGSLKLSWSTGSRSHINF